jgi:hypothetical protein
LVYVRSTTKLVLDPHAQADLRSGGRNGIDETDEAIGGGVGGSSTFLEPEITGAVTSGVSDGNGLR